MIPISICVGCGLAVDPITGFLSVERRPGGGIGCTNTGAPDDGLFIESGSTSVITDPTNTIVFSGNGSSGSHLSAAVVVSPNDCNALVNPGNGLYVACQDGVVGVDQHDSPQGPFPAVVNAVGPDNLYNFESTVFHICNPTCCIASGSYRVRVGGLFVDMHAASYGFGILQIGIDGGGFFNATPNTAKVVHNHIVGSPIMFADCNNLTEENFITFGAGQCYDLRANLQWKQQVGAADLHGMVNFEFNLQAVHTDCCDHRN